MNVIGYTESGMIRVIFDGEENETFVPDVTENSHRQMIAVWEAAGNLIPPYAAPAVDLEAYVAQKRWEREVGGIEFAGLTIATDDRSKIMISGARMKADRDPDFVTSWKGPDGQHRQLDANTIIAVSDAVLDHVNACFVLEASVLAQIAAGDIADATAVDNAFDD